MEAEIHLQRNSEVIIVLHNRMDVMQAFIC